MTTSSEHYHIARDLQRKLSEDVIKAAMRVIDLAPAEGYVALSLQGVCATLDLTAQLIEHELGFDKKARHLTVYLIALMAAHGYASSLPIASEALFEKARDDMHKLGLIPPRSTT